MKVIPVNTPLLDGNERQYLNECIKTGWISSEGPFVRQFEEEFAARVGRCHGIAVCNGSAALDIAVAAMDIGPGDEVIMPTFTIISCAAAVVRAGATPVFVDSDPVTWNMDVRQVGDRITANTRAVMPVHIYGLPVDMTPLLEITSRHGLSVIEDAAEAHGLDYAGKPCGGFGDISTFSFYPNKHVTAGEGGMLVTNDDALADRCRSLRNLCFKREQRFIHDELGWNYRMSNLQAAVGVAQLEQIDRFINIKREMGRRYTQQLSGIAGLQLPVATIEQAENVYWVYGLVLDDDVPFEARFAMKRLSEQGIGTRPFFWPMHEQPVLRTRKIGVSDSLPVAERLARRGFYLPSGLALKEDQIDRVSEAVRDLVA